MSWEIVVGLETHTQLLTRSKIFSGASTDFGAPPNTQASAVDLALPGTLPVLNRAALEHAGDHGAGAEVRAADVDLVDAPPVRGIDLPAAAARAADPGVVDEQVYLPGLRERVLDRLR